MNKYPEYMGMTYEAASKEAVRLRVNGPRPWFDLDGRLEALEAQKSIALRHADMDRSAGEAKGGREATSFEEFAGIILALNAFFEKHHLQPPKALVLADDHEFFTLEQLLAASGSHMQFARLGFDSEMQFAGLKIRTLANKAPLIG